MKRNMKATRPVLEWLAVLCLVVVGLPLLGIAEFILRGFLLAASGIGIVVGAVCYWLNPRFRAWLDGRVSPQSPLLTHGRVRH